MKEREQQSEIGKDRQREYGCDRERCEIHLKECARRDATELKGWKEETEEDAYKPES